MGGEIRGWVGLRAAVAGPGPAFKDAGMVGKQDGDPGHASDRKPRGEKRTGRDCNAPGHEMVIARRVSAQATAWAERRNGARVAEPDAARADAINGPT